MWKSFASLTSRDTTNCLYIAQGGFFFHPEYSGPTVLTKENVVVVFYKDFCVMQYNHYPQSFIVNIDIYDVIGIKYTCIHGDI